jgi:hypothetical protein
MVYLLKMFGTACPKTKARNRRANGLAGQPNQHIHFTIMAF